MSDMQDTISAAHLALHARSASAYTALPNPAHPDMPFLTSVIPLVFVLIWSTGFVVAKYSMPDAEPFTFLTMRMGATVLAMLPLLYLFGQPPPRRWWPYRHDMVVGLLLQTGYLGAYFWAIRLGADAGTSAIIVGLQPILTTALAVRLMGESFSPRIGLGLLLGFIGIGIVITAQKGLNLHSGIAPSIWHYVLPAIALLSVSLSLVYQKRFCHQSNHLTGTWMQYVAALASCPVLALVCGESGQIEWTLPFTLAFIWQVCGLSIGAVLLLMWMVKQGEASRVASLFYLVPPLVVIEAYWLFGEQLSPWAWLGMALAIIGVLLSRHRSGQALILNNRMKPDAGRIINRR